MELISSRLEGHEDNQVSPSAPPFQQQFSAANSSGNKDEEDHSGILDTSDEKPTILRMTKNDTNTAIEANRTSSPLPPPVVYGELSILGYNGYIPHVDRGGRRSKSKYLLCKRPTPNGIKKSEHYIVKQPQATKVLQDKHNYSISYTFSRSQTIIVEYKQDDKTDLFQIGRSSEDPIDFVVMDTVAANYSTNESSSSHHSKHHHHHSSNKHHSSTSHQQQQHHHHHHHSHAQTNGAQHQPQHSSENASSSGQIQTPYDLVEMTRFHRHLAKVEEDMLQRGLPPYPFDPRGRLPPTMYGQVSGQPQLMLMNYPQPNLSNLPPLMAEHFRRQDPSLFHMPPHYSATAPNGSQHNHHHHHHHHSNDNQYHHQHQAMPTPAHHQHYMAHQMRHPNIADQPSSSHDNRYQHQYRQHHQQQQLQQQQHPQSATNHSSSHSKRSHTAQSTISRFACRIIVDREPPYAARIYAAGFDSSRNIFLGEKATKWEHKNSIDGLTTNGILIMHPKRGYFCDSQMETPNESNNSSSTNDDVDKTRVMGDQSSDAKMQLAKNDHDHDYEADGDDDVAMVCDNDNDDHDDSERRRRKPTNDKVSETSKKSSNKTSDSNNNTEKAILKVSDENFEYGGVWREVSVDGGIYAIRESRSAVQKGKRIDTETNILQDGTLIDLCGATLLWRSLDGFKSSPTKRTLEEKVDLLNASRPQCPVGLNTLVIPRKPIIPINHQSPALSSSNERHHRRHSSHHHSSNDYVHNHHHQQQQHPSSGSGTTRSGSEKDISSQQPYVYLRCGHVQGYHDWGTTDKSDQRTCPICLSVGTVAKLSMGLEPSFYVDSGPLTHVFNPCGHMASERTIKYWTSIKIPHGTHFFHSICPFCATPLATNTEEPTSTRLIFQEDLD